MLQIDSRFRIWGGIEGGTATRVVSVASLSALRRSGLLRSALPEVEFTAFLRLALRFSARLVRNKRFR